MKKEPKGVGTRYTVCQFLKKYNKKETMKGKTAALYDSIGRIGALKWCPLCNEWEQDYAGIAQYKRSRDYLVVVKERKR
jgi:hypothetical protein